MIVTSNHLKGFTVITRKELNTDFNAITELNGYIYIATTDGFYTMVDREIAYIAHHWVSKLGTIEDFLRTR